MLHSYIPPSEATGILPLSARDGGWAGAGGALATRTFSVVWWWPQAMEQAWRQRSRAHGRAPRPDDHHVVVELFSDSYVLLYGRMVEHAIPPVSCALRDATL
jgi:hypothetical protein